nr:hypothetical protein [Tanacetum cinerariifolium]
GISILLAVGTSSTGSGKLYCQWELSSSSGNTLCILFPIDIATYIDKRKTLSFAKIENVVNIRRPLTFLFDFSRLTVEEVDTLKSLNVVVTEMDCIELESWLPMREDLDIFHA